MRKIVLAAFLFVSTMTTNTFADIKMGIILGFTGPIESLTPAMAASAELAFKEASDSGSLLGIVLIGFDPKIADEILGFLLICCMAFFYALAQVFSRYLKELDVKFTNACMGGIGFISLLILSIYFEGNTITHLKQLNTDAWLLALYHGVLCSLMGHMSMFYLYKFYPVGQVLPFYALFPVFGILLSFFIFGEIPTLIMVIGGIIVITSVFLLQKIR